MKLTYIPDGIIRELLRNGGDTDFGRLIEEVNSDLDRGHINVAEASDWVSMLATVRAQVEGRVFVVVERDPA